MAAEPSILHRIRNRRGVRQLVKFGIVGSSGFLVNLIAYTILQMAYPNAKVQYDKLFFSVGFMAGGVSNYFLNRIWTFRSSGHVVKEGVQFLTVSAIALVFGLVIKEMASPMLGYGHKSWFVGTCAGIIVNFFVNKYWTFRSAA